MTEPMTPALPGGAQEPPRSPGPERTAMAGRPGWPSDAAQHDDVTVPHRDRPFTGDEVVDSALMELDGTRGLRLEEMVSAAQACHHVLQERLQRP